MSKIVFLVQNLAHKSDSVGFDCIFEYKCLENSGQKAIIFADVFDLDLHPGVEIRPFSEFYDFHKTHNEVKIIYHFCDGWEGLDDYLINNPQNVFVRWHNNTPPWFYALKWPEFAKGALRGFKVISKMAAQTELKFLVNSEFTKRQLEALGGWNKNIFPVFPGSPFLKKERIPYQVKASQSEIDILFVSRVVPHKGHKHILTIADLIQRYSGKKVNVNFVGMVESRMKSYERFLLNEGSKLELNVYFHGLLSEAELHQKYMTSDVFMCMSEHEGFGMPIFEAMRCGIPIVAWANTAFSDLLEQHPLTTQIFDPYWFAAATLIAIEKKDIDERVAGIQDKLLEIYNEPVVANQLMHAVDYDEQFSIRKYKIFANDISEIISNLELKIRNHVKDACLYEFDAHVNYFSFYDIDVYEKLLNDQVTINKHKNLISDGASFNRFEALIRDIYTISPADFREKLGDIKNIFYFDDEVFVRSAFLYFDMANDNINLFKYFLRKIRKGGGKENILNEILQYKKVKINFSHRSQKCFYNGASSKIYRMEDNIRRLKRALYPDLHIDPVSQSLVNGVDLDDLLYFEDGKFIEYSFRYILGRLPDDNAVKHYKKCFANNMDRTDFLRELNGSEEAKTHAINKVYGLERLYSPEYGKISFFDKKEIQSDLSKRISRLENEIGQIIMMLATNNTPLSIVDSKKENLGVEEFFPELNKYFNIVRLSDISCKIRSVEDLLELSDDEFICAAFRKILGRPIDENGLLHYQDVLASGETRDSIIKELANCEEAVVYGIRLKGLEKFIERSILDYESMNRKSVSHANDLLTLEDYFLETLFMTLLGREGDENGINYYQSLLDKGESREAVIREMASSEEAIAYACSLPGLMDIINKLEGNIENETKLL